LANTLEETGGTAEAAARECLSRGIASLASATVERRHESLMEWAEGELGLERSYAEQVYAIAEEEQLEPIYAFQLVRCGIGVRELAPPEQDMEETVQQAPPEWVAEETVELAEVTLERHLRATFRRLRGHLEHTADAGAAVEAFLRETDIGLVPLR
jgi:hypothetical protein